MREKRETIKAPPVRSFNPVAALRVELNEMTEERDVLLDVVHAAAGILGTRDDVLATFAEQDADKVRRLNEVITKALEFYGE